VTTFKAPPPADLGLNWVQEVAEDVPRAVVICVKVGRVAPTIDPDASFGEQGWLLHLRTLNVRGKRLVTLCETVCGGNYTLLLAVLRAVQLGIEGETWLRMLIDRAEPIQEAAGREIVDQIRHQLPGFARQAVAE